MIIFLIILCVVLLILVSFLSFRLIKMNDMHDVYVEQVEQSLDIIDDCYRRISSVAEMPVMFDDPVIHQLLSDIKHTKYALLLIANKISLDEYEENETE